MKRALGFYLLVLGVAVAQGTWVPQTGPGQSGFFLKPRPQQTGMLPRTIPPNLPACQHGSCSCYWLVVVEATDWRSPHGSTQSNLNETVYLINEEGRTTKQAFLMCEIGARSNEGEVGLAGKALLCPQGKAFRQRQRPLRAQSDSQSGLFFGVYHKAACPDCSGANGTPRCYVQGESRPAAFGTATKVGRSKYEYEFLMVTNFTSCSSASNLLHVVEKEDFDGTRVSTATVSLPAPLNSMGQVTQNSNPIALGLSNPTNRFYSSLMRFEGKNAMMEEVMMFGQIKGRIEVEPNTSMTQVHACSMDVVESSHNMRLSFLCPCDNASHADPPNGFEDGIQPSGTTSGRPGVPGGATSGANEKKCRYINNVPHGGGMLLGGMECQQGNVRPLPHAGYRLR